MKTSEEPIFPKNAMEGIAVAAYALAVGRKHAKLLEPMEPESRQYVSFASREKYLGQMEMYFLRDRNLQDRIMGTSFRGISLTRCLKLEAQGERLKAKIEQMQKNFPFMLDTYASTYRSSNGLELRRQINQITILRGT